MTERLGGRARRGDELVVGVLADDEGDEVGPRAGEPRDDLMTNLVQAEVDGQRLTQQEIQSFFVLLTAAGNETTRNASTWGLHLLTEHPDQRARWLADPDGLAVSAVEEAGFFKRLWDAFWMWWESD